MTGCEIHPKYTLIKFRGGKQMRKFIVTTSIGKRKFKRTFKLVSSVDRYLAGAKALKRQHPESVRAKIVIQTKYPGKKITKGIVKYI